MKRARPKKPSPVDTWVAVSGGFDPLHIGHVRMFKKARALGDKLVVIVNNDHWLRKKKGFAFMPQKERVELIRSLPFVDKVVLTNHTKGDSDMSVNRTLRKVKPDIFANGGDRKKMSDIPEAGTCKEFGIKMAFNIGEGGKIQSSSWMIANASRPIKRSERPWGEYYGWDQGKGWNLKTIYIKPGKRLSLQYHHHRMECWLLVSGDATATLHDSEGRPQIISLKKGTTYCVEKRQVHRLESKKGGIVVEVAYGAFDEADIVRLEDDHGRTGHARS
jgi:D-beta-D-heptose 7-phosphate kinase/D-beta-D-heptose 1-phosphate adenosyltransferase